MHDAYESDGKMDDEDETVEVQIQMTRIDIKEQSFGMRAQRDITVAAIKDRIKLETGVALHEQLLMFKGRKITDENVQPLDTDELDDLIDEAGDDGIPMAFVYRPKLAPSFLLQEKLVDEYGQEDINARRKTGATVLHRAARLYDVAVAIEVLDERQDFTLTDARDKNGQTALHVAVSCNSVEFCELLLKSERFTAIGARDENGQTALHLAACWGWTAVVELILMHPQFEAKIARAKDKQGLTPLQCAEDRGWDEAALLIRSALNAADEPASPSGAGWPTSPSNAGEPTSPNTAAEPTSPGNAEAPAVDCSEDPGDDRREGPGQLHSVKSDSEPSAPTEEPPVTAGCVQAASDSGAAEDSGKPLY